LLTRFDVHPSQAIFLDDSIRNIQGAEAVRIEGIHFQSTEQLLITLKEKELL
jgi:2-haloacid dehalogenase